MRNTIYIAAFNIKLKYLAVCLVFLNFSVFSQGSKFKVTYSALGELYLDSLGNTFLGTAFVAVKNNVIFTASHVIKRNKIVFYKPSYSKNLIKVTLKQSYPVFDIAVMSATDNISNGPFRISSVRPKVNDTVYYLGLDVRENIFRVAPSSVISEGFVQSEGVFTYGFTFPSEVFYGYSGGPVLNTSGEVIGIIISMKGEPTATNKTVPANALMIDMLYQKLPLID